MQSLPVSGPDTVAHVEELFCVVVEVVVVVVVVEVLVVVVDVVVVDDVVHVFVVQTDIPLESHTHVLQSTVKDEPGVHVVKDPWTGQEAGHSPSLPSRCSPALSVAVLHQALTLSKVVQLVYTAPLYLKGNTHCPLGVEQGTRPRSSLEQELVVEAVWQSPQLFVITLSDESTAVAHQGAGESV